jgi:D-tyrosyl-tRNA(Tyr) deacylase
VFADDQGKMNRSVTDVSGSLLVVSQFTLYGDAKKGTRPSYIESAGPEFAEKMYDEMVQYFRSNSEVKVETGEFAAMMDVELVNDGPVTLILER